MHYLIMHGRMECEREKWMMIPNGENSGVTSVRQFSFNSIISIIAIFTFRPTHRFAVLPHFFHRSHLHQLFLILGKIEI
jgi:hypothetical protein